MKKQILIVAVVLSSLAVTANAQDRKAAPKTKKETTATVATDVSKPHLVAKKAHRAQANESAKAAKPAEQKKTTK